MSYYAINGDLYLLGNVPFNNDYLHTIDFDNADDQKTWFLAKNVYTCGSYQHVRKDSTVKVPYNIESLYSVNYVLYRNYNTSKWIYAFITEKTYINEGVTELKIETDVMQTYMFDYTFKDSFVEREHASRWAAVNVPVYSLTDEGLTLGDEYVMEASTNIAGGGGWFLITSTAKLERETGNDWANSVQNYPTPLYYYIYNGSQNVSVMLANEPSIISVQKMQFAPFETSALTSVTFEDPDTQLTCTMYRVLGDMETHKAFTAVSKFTGATLPTSFATGVARDKKYESKLLCYPYSFNKLTEYQGNEIILKNEYLTGENVTVTLVQNLSHDLKRKFYVSSGYKGDIYGKEASLINNTVNEMPLVTDYYKQYMLEHKTSAISGMALSGIEAGAAIAAAPFTGGISLAALGAVGMNAAGQIGGELAKQKDLKNVPDSIRSMGNNMSFDIADANVYVKLVRFAIHDDIKQMLADYWAMYGYKCQRVKTPSLRSRYYYNYLKTIGANLTGNIEQGHMNKLKSIFDNGVTIWHNRSGVVPLSYQYDNVEMSLLT